MEEIIKTESAVTTTAEATTSKPASAQNAAPRTQGQNPQYANRGQGGQGGFNRSGGGQGGFNRSGGGQGGFNRSGGERSGRPGGRPRDRDQKEDDGLIKKLVAVNRVTKVVKGGRTMRFSALVVVGDGNGKVGVGMGKAAEVPQAIEKATSQAKNLMQPISVVGTTIPHEIVGVYGRGRVILLPAQEGTGVIAGASVKAVLDAAGIKDIRSKSYGSNNPINCVKATLAGLVGLRTAEQIAALRGKTVAEIL